jgi:hypothetical protein
MCVPHLHGDMAALPERRDTHEDEHALVVDVEEPLRLELERLPRQRAHELAPGFQPVKDRCVRVNVREVDLDIRCNQSAARWKEPSIAWAGSPPKSANPCRTISTFSCDVAYAVSRDAGPTPVGSAGDDQCEQQYRDPDRNHQRETHIHAVVLPPQPRSPSKRGETSVHPSLCGNVPAARKSGATAVPA